MRTAAAFWLLPAFAFSAALACQEKPSHSFQPNDGWWAYQPVLRPPVPTVADASWPRHPVDAFVLQRLEAAGLQPNPPADPATLLRRVTYDLTGLPPTPAELAAFLGDDAPDAYERVVDRLLASPQYGVQWARHWLDLVRYAETDGYERDRTKPAIWRYRDWVVDALNADLPYADFLRMQLAGDELPEPRVQDLVATGFYRLGIWDDEPTDPLQARYDDLDGIADTTARAMLGVSMGCARCHDHKKDPLPQRDYYSFLSFFENLQPYDLQAHAVPVDGAVARHAEATAAFAARQQAVVARVRAAATAAAAAVPAATVQGAAATSSADLVARYSGDHLHATEFRDEVGGHHGTISGQIAPIDGHQGGAMRLDGDDHALIPRVVSESFTVSLFVRSDRRGAGRGEDTRWFTGTGLVDGEVPGIVADWGIAWHSDGRVVAGSGAPETFVASPPGYHDGQWHHVAFTRDQRTGRIALYVDAVLVGEANGSKRPLVAPPQLAIGRSLPGGRGFRGDLDEITFWRRALTAPEVAALALDLPGGFAVTARADDAGLAAALAELAGLRRPELATIEVLSVREQGRNGPQGYVRPRGNAHQQGAAVEPGFPAMLGGGVAASTPAPAGRPASGRRTALAAWITDPANPLTWRVVANRLWQHHFGRGIVRSSNEFGRLGDLPTHPELLDWLASEVLAQGGSLKAMHRLLVTSATYRMASAPAPASANLDPQNDLFWRVDRRRLTAEQVRDSMLASSGELNLLLAGPPVYPPLPAMVLATASRPDEAWGRSSPEQAARRSLYVHQKRSLQEPLLAVFDQADTDNSCPVRFATVQATQALTLMNGEFSHARATAMAARLQREATSLSEQIDAGLRLVTQRPARLADRERLVALAQELQQGHGKSAAEALQRCCLVMLNCNEFLYLD